MKQLSGLDSIFLNFETADAPMHVGGVSVIDLARAPKGFGFESVRARISGRLHLLPSFRRRLVQMPLNLIPPFWIEDPDFRFDAHVQRVKLKRPGSDAQLAELVAGLVGKPLDRSRPLWSFHYVEGLAGRRAACISIIHHACIDGVSGAELLSKLLDLEPDAGVTPPPSGEWDPDEMPKTIDRMLFTARQSLGRFRQFAGLVKETLPVAAQLGRSLLGGGKAAADGAVPGPGDEGGFAGFKAAPRTRFNVRIDGRRSYAFRSLSLTRIKALKNKLGITVNDAVLSVCAGALRQYLLEKNELPDQPLVAAVPISVRTADERDAGGNRVSMLSAELPTQLEAPLERVAGVSRSTAKLKKTHQAVPARLLMDWMELPAPALMASAARLYENFVNRDRVKPLVNVVISNVPGPPVPLYLAGAPLLANYPVSIPYHGLALNITVISYRDQLDVGLTAFREAVPDLDHLLDLMAAELEVLEAAAGLAAAPPAAAPPPAPRKHAVRRAAEDTE